MQQYISTLWTADAWLSWTSFCLEGLFSSQEKAIEFAKQEKLIGKNCHVVICKGELDDYEATAEKVFSTEFDSDRAQLAEVH